MNGELRHPLKRTLAGYKETRYTADCPQREEEGNCKSLFKLFAHEAQEKYDKVDLQFQPSLTCPGRRGRNLPYQGPNRDPKAFQFLAKGATIILMM